MNILPKGPNIPHRRLSKQPAVFAIELAGTLTCPTDRRQLTHPLDTQVALHRHQLPDLVVEAVLPGFVLLWRRASTFCKAPLKNRLPEFCLPPAASAARPAIAVHVLCRSPADFGRRQAAPADRATCTAAADARPVPPKARRLCRNPSAARLPSSEMPWDNAQSFALPLAVPFPAKPQVPDFAKSGCRRVSRDFAEHLQSHYTKSGLSDGIDN